MSELANAEIVNLFASPFISYRWPDSDELNKELRQRVLAHERDNPGRSQSKSNVGGWHSETGQLEFCGAAGKTLLHRATELANEATRQVLVGRQVPAFSWRTEAWANVNRPGDFNRSHVHGLSTWSGTYYVDPGEPEDPGSGTALEITDPCQARATTFFPAFLPPGIFIRPEPGLMVLFASYMPHMVFPHRGKRPRISIAFNFRKEPFP
jgi:uncharacterized protein (TIGR02466 family)